ncbi:MAG: DUF1015 domain-containing protein [Pseudomonadota bacterium]
MAQLMAFNGLLYNPEKIPLLKDVATPPYDVISPEKQDAFYEAHPNNIIRLILGKSQASDTQGDCWQTRSAEYFCAWQEEKVLLQDKVPSFYFTEMDYIVDGKSMTRCGLIALVRLEDFTKGEILPHERTFSATKSVRFRLIEAAKANFSQIFSLYSDPGLLVNELCHDYISGKSPDINFQDSDGVFHRLWRVAEEDVINAIRDIFLSKPLYIADGHHRYETALRYRDKCLNEKPNLPENALCRYVMMYLSSMHDPGLTVLPTHRVLHGLANEDMDTFFDKASNYFDIETIENSSGDRIFLERLRTQGKVRNAIGVFMKTKEAFYVLSLKPEIMNEAFCDTIHTLLKRLDVTILTQIVLKKILGLTEEYLDDEKSIKYISNDKDAIAYVRDKNGSMAFILNPTKVEQVQQTSNANLVMPRKSTYFYPKVVTGMVLHKLE